MTQDVLIGIRGLHTAGEGIDDDIEVIFPASCRHLGDMWCVYYTEPVEGHNETIQNLIKLKNSHIEVTKKGLTNTHMVFEEGKKTLTWYETPLGSVSLGIAATSVKVRESEDRIEANAVYALDVNEEHMADCTISINIIAREGNAYAQEGSSHRSI